MRRLIAPLCCSGLLVIAGCGHRVQTVAAAPPPPSIPSASSRVSPMPPPDTSADASVADSRTPIYSEVGMASWYGPQYHNRQGANGQIYNQNSVSAAHRTLPMNSLIRVTNLQTGQSAVMRITDRGPFVPDRVIDLSVGAAKLVGIWRPGTAKVRIDVYQAPRPIEEGGKWCVQVGAFSREGAAKKLEAHLSHQYESANVIEFTGPTGHWVRIKPENGDRHRAMEIAKNIKPQEGEAYLVRLD